ncbi:MAG: LysR family transcriptional regulator [Lachnospiraceae bacterium]|nr:LysR family transcriptional regulator [Lachnospiraceae bacterium]
MEFRQLEAFVNAVKYKSFSKAADATFLTQPTISTHISNLETELGVRLLNRKGREITLTSQGQEFYGYAMELLNTRERALDHIHNQSKEVDGILEIQTSSIPGHSFLPMLMDEFHKRYPKVRFYVEQTDSRTVNENILNQRGEIGFTGYKGNSALAFETVFEDEMVLITPDIEKYRSYKNGEEIPTELFIHEPFIMREDGSGTKQEMEQAQVNGKAVFKHIEVIAKMTNMEAVKQVVGRGLGVSIVSEQVVKETAESEKIRYFKIQGLEKKRCFYLTYNKNVVLSPTAELFLKFVRERTSAQ